MKYGRGITHLEEVASECDLLNERLEMMKSEARLTSVWAYGQVLDGADAWDPEWETMAVALEFDLPADQLCWRARPALLEFAVGLCGWQKRPVAIAFRSAQVPVWNHAIERPLLLWSTEGGLKADAVAALHSGEAGTIERLRLAAPAEAELRERLAAEQTLTLAALRRTTEAWEAERWGRGDLRKLAEPMWEAAAGHLELADALAALS